MGKTGNEMILRKARRKVKDKAGAKDATVEKVEIEI